MTAPAIVPALIAIHIRAQAEHDRLFNLSDWGMADHDEVQEAVAAIDRALIAICAARPSSPEDAKLRREYLIDRLPSALEGCPGLTKAGLAALIDAAGVQP